ncbi:MAG: hypothetical protein HYU88_07710 [Chloroflexi bacterium]|nr:hypothetical protein [Chloroflexota bacterium]MBI4506589.1 hypothetical protein [Chloroflexota bacterium]
MARLGCAPSAAGSLAAPTPPCYDCCVVKEAALKLLKDSINLRWHRNGCPFYREDWTVSDALYRSICLRDTPPETAEEQERCMGIGSKQRCWRDRLPHRQILTQLALVDEQRNGSHP